MANPEHVAKLRQGDKVWNEWRLNRLGLIPTLNQADLSRADLSRVNLSNADLSNADLSGAILSVADFRKAILSYAHLSGAILRTAYLSEAYLRRADLRRADLSGAVLNNADLSYADLSNADFTGARLFGANLTGAVLNGADLHEASLNDTVFADTDLNDTKGLESAVHRGPSPIGIDTFFRSRGNIPEAFLRGAGVPDVFIKYMSSLAGKPIEYYSAFISYSSKDEDSAKRLHADLQAKGVRCWFAPEDLKIGDKFRTKIDEAIRIHDKLLLVLSENSVRSDWVEAEVESALDRERKENRTVLFPIRLDSAVMDMPDSWPALIRRTRHIGDFTKWKDHDSYQKAFDRLLRDLKADRCPTSNDKAEDAKAAKV